MAANNKKNSTSYQAAFDPSNTTYVQAEPSRFKEIVQRLTGAPPPSQEKVVLSSSRLAAAGKLNSGEMGPRRPSFKLHERRLQTLSRKLEIGVGSHSPRPNSFLGYVGGGGGEMVMPSPVSPLEWLARGTSPRTPGSPMMMSENHQEMMVKGIWEKGFYVQPTPVSTRRGSDPPELLPLFPLHSPRDD